MVLQKGTDYTKLTLIPNLSSVFTQKHILSLLTIYVYGFVLACPDSQKNELNFILHYTKHEKQKKKFQIPSHTVVINIFTFLTALAFIV